MAETPSTKPYLIRALHEWCTDYGYVPHLLVAVDAQTHVPKAYVKNGEIVLNVNYSATKNLQITNEAVSFSARFAGVSEDLYIPIAAVKGIFARETGQGMFFQVGEAATAAVQAVPSASDDTPEPPKPTKKPTLKLIK
jgi:stringent starvation protein B